MDCSNQASHQQSRGGKEYKNLIIASRLLEGFKKDFKKHIN
jgi:hypothetical protein